MAMNIKTHLKRSFLLITLFLVVINHAFADDDSVHQFVSKQKIIRTYEDLSPNFGNLATTIGTMDRLREMGFNGVFEFIYSAKTKKVPKLFNLPENIPQNYLDKENNIRFITFAEYYNELKTNTLTPIALSIVGGGENLVSALKQEGVDVNWNRDEFPYNNAAYMLKSKVSLEITPWMEEGCKDSNDPDDDGESSIIHVDNQQKVIKLCGSTKQFFVAPFANLNNAKTYLQSTQAGLKLAKEKPALPTLISLIENKKINLISAYGNTIKMTDYDESDQSYLQAILGVISGGRYAQLHMPDGIKKPLIIAAYMDYDKEANEVVKFLHSKELADYHFTGKENAKKMLDELQVSSIFDIANITNPGTEQKLLHLQPGQILLLSLGALPKVVFDGIYNYTAENSWPQIREGENTKNSLLMTGRPHIRIAPSEEGAWELADAGFGPDVFDTTKNLSHKYHDFVFYNAVFWDKQPPTEMLGNYIIDAQDPNSQLSRYFEWLKIQALKPENDRIYAGLKAAIEKIK